MFVSINLKLKKFNFFKKRSFNKRMHIDLSLKAPIWERKNSFSIFFKNITYFELNFLKFIFFKFRRCFMRKQYYITLNISPNFMFSKKSKNARMGKGVGAFQRSVRLVKASKPFLSTSRFSKKRFELLKKAIFLKSPNIFF